MQSRASRATGKKRGGSKSRFRQGEPLWLEAPAGMRAPGRVSLASAAATAAAAAEAAESGEAAEEQKNDSSGRMMRDFRCALDPLRGRATSSAAPRYSPACAATAARSRASLGLALQDTRGGVAASE